MTKILKKQTTINEWQNYWICYEMDLETQEYEKGDEEKECKDIEYCCPECGKNIEYDLISKFYE